MSQKRYNQEFKQTVVSFIIRVLRSVNYLANRVFQKSQFINGIKQHSTIEGSQELTVADVDAIQKENLRLKKELEILKKAMAIFARK